MRQGQYEEAISQFERVLKENPQDTSVLLVQARAYYYKGDINRAYDIADHLVQQRPDNTDALFLKASLERSRRNRNAALALLDETLKHKPDHSAALAMRRSILASKRVTLRTRASYTREVGREGEDDKIDQDLRSFSYGATLGFSAIPRTNSSFSYTLRPSNMPFGGLRGAVAAHQFFYRQESYLSRDVRLRVGGGMVRFGPGELVRIPGHPAPVRSAELSPLATVGLRWRAAKKVRLSASWSRSAIAYTPTSVRMGVIENRFSGGASFPFTPSTRLSVDYDYGRYASREFNGITSEDTSHRAFIDFTQNVVRTEHIVFDAGYSGRMWGNPGDDDVFLGFFNPVFYQRHLFDTRFYAKLAGPLGFNFLGGAGLQDEDDRSPRFATRIRPSFIVQLNEHVAISFGYTYYNTSGALRTISGDGVFIATDWRF